jgi:MFS family permease
VPAGPAGTAGAGWRQLLNDRPIRLYLIGGMVFGMGAVIATTMYPIVQVDRLNLSYTVVGLLGFVQSLFWLLGYLFGGHLVDRFGGIRCLQAMFVLYVVVLLPYAVASQAWMLVPAFVASGLVNAGTDLANLYTVMALAGPERVPETSALNSTCSGLRGLVGPFIGPLLVQFGWPLWSIFVLCAVLAVAGAGFLQQPRGRPALA